MTYDDEVKKAVYFYCGLLPRDIEYMDPADLDLILSTAIDKRKLEAREQDIRAAKVAADIMNHLTLIAINGKLNFIDPIELLPENRGKKIEQDNGVDENQFLAWAKAHNERVNNGCKSNGDP